MNDSVNGGVGQPSKMIQPLLVTVWVCAGRMQLSTGSPLES